MPAPPPFPSSLSSSSRHKKPPDVALIREVGGTLVDSANPLAEGHSAKEIGRAAEEAKHQPVAAEIGAAERNLLTSRNAQSLERPDGLIGAADPVIAFPQDEEAVQDEFIADSKRAHTRARKRRNARRSRQYKKRRILDLIQEVDDLEQLERRLLSEQSVLKAEIEILKNTPITGSVNSASPAATNQTLPSLVLEALLRSIQESHHAPSTTSADMLGATSIPGLPAQQKQVTSLAINSLIHGVLQQSGLLNIGNQIENSRLFSTPEHAVVGASHVTIPNFPTLPVHLLAGLPAGTALLAPTPSAANHLHSIDSLIRQGFFGGPPQQQ